MDLSVILSITGKSGLFQLISKTKNNFIVESLADGKRFPAFSNDGVASLENILIFTDDGDISLETVFRTIFNKENGQKVSSNLLTDNNKMKAYFTEILPNYDKERVYTSNIKKILTWYNTLADKGLIDNEIPESQETQDPEAQSTEA
ncbi:MAG: DUF5606 domain-containing protein [Bacteroidales bacterium]|jgi:hypothetical protein|nr:DUF5606 domain-containing protein [Bacteroidales bacterium]